jgi:NADPH-dependent ferric siderophore reductase
LVVVEIEDSAEQQTFTSAAQVDVIWVVRSEQNLVDVVRKLEMPEGELYAWVATEAGLSRKVRRVLLSEFGLSEALVKTSGYWRIEAAAD